MSSETETKNRRKLAQIMFWKIRKLTYLDIRSLFGIIAQWLFSFRGFLRFFILMAVKICANVYSACG